MKKIAIVTMDYLPATGGVAVYWASLFKYLPKDKYLLVVPGNKTRGSLVGVSFFYKFIWPKWFKLLLKLPYLIKKHKIRLIIAGQVLPIGTACYILKKWGILSDYHISCHSMDLAIPKGRKRVLAKKILKNASKIMVNSKTTKDLALKYGISENIIYMVKPCPDVLSKSSLNVRKKYDIRTDNIILSLGRLTERKGFDNVIKSLPQVWKKVPDLVYIIAGGGQYKAKLEKIISKIIPIEKRKNIVFTGRFDNKDKANYYNASKVFVLPTRDIKGDVEGFGIVNIEAGLSSLPVIAGKISGETGSVINNKTGILVNPNSVDEIANSITNLILDPELSNELGQNNLNYAKSFNWRYEAQALIKNTL